MSDIFDINAAKSQQEEHLVVEAIIKVIDKCIDQPIEKITLGDFTYICYWLRLNSYSKSPLVVTWHCGHKDCNCTNSSRVLKSDLRIIIIDDIIEPKSYLEIPTIRNYIDYLELLNKEPNRKQILDSALWLRADTMQDKLALLKQQPNLDWYEDARALSVSVGNHGVDEYINVACLGDVDKRGCGEISRLKLDVQLQSFFP
jgi:hypothetical protein